MGRRAADVGRGRRDLGRDFSDRGGREGGRVGRGLLAGRPAETARDSSETGPQRVSTFWEEVFLTFRVMCYFYGVKYDTNIKKHTLT